MNFPKARQIINHQGCVLVFPINNQKEPLSLWSSFFPRTPLRWEWDANGDDRVSQMWFGMKKLSQDKRVVYSKWYQGRATFFSQDVFIALRAFLRPQKMNLSRTSREILEILESDSPLSTKQIKQMADLRGKDNESAYHKAMRSLFEQTWIVGFGEVDDGAFPSLAVGAADLLFEDLCLRAQKMSRQEAGDFLKDKLSRQPKLLKSIDKIAKE